MGAHMATASVVSKIPMTNRTGRKSNIPEPYSMGEARRRLVNGGGLSSARAPANSARESEHYAPETGLPMAARNSRRVEGSSLNAPIIWLVTMVAPGVWMPRGDMQAWLASITTPTPLGCNT